MDLIKAGRKVADMARDLDISSQAIYTWPQQDRINRELEAGDRAGARGGTLERQFEAVAVMVGEGIPIEVTCRVLEVSVSGYYA